MKNNIYFYISLDENLDVISKDERLYTSLEKCLSNAAYNLMGKDGIKPNSGILTSDDGKVEYTLIERYQDQFNLLNRTIYVYYIFGKEIALEDEKIIVGDRIVDIQKIENLLQYLTNNDNFNLVKNNKDKFFYDIPYSNYDIIKGYFLSVIQVKGKIRKKRMITYLKKKLPSQSSLINKIEKLMFKMDNEQFIKFLDDIYNKREDYIDTGMFKGYQKNT